MENPAWNPDLFDWLASDLIAHDYDLKHTIELIVTSRAYQLPATDDAELRTPGSKDGSRFTFAGPRFRRLSAEQYADAICAIGQTQWALVTPAPPKSTSAKPDPKNVFPPGRAWTHARSAFQESLGRTDRNNVTTIRETDASTLQALQILTGPDLGGALDKIAGKLLENKPTTKDLTMTIHARAFGRAPTPAESKIAEAVLGPTPTVAMVADYLWLVIALPEFQVIN
jgi:hypothetical protein